MSLTTSLSSVSLKPKASRLALHDIREIETWIMNLLAAPVPVPGIKCLIYGKIYIMNGTMEYFTVASLQL